MLRSSVFIFLLFFFTAIGKAQVSPMNVLFIGNSYTHMNKMPSLFEKIAVSKGIKVNVEMSAESGHSFRLHSEREDLYEDIKSEKWDYIVLQGFSRELSQSIEHIDTASVPYLNRILDSIYVNNPCTNVLLFMTWGYRNGFEEREEINSYTKMSDSVRRGYEYVSHLYQLPVVPVGSVWKDVNTESRINLYKDDGRHPSLHGTYLIAYTFYAAIFKGTAVNTYLGKNISKKDAKYLQKAAYGCVRKNLEKYRLLQNTLSVTGERTKKGEYFVHCWANYPKATSLIWEFGDGEKANEESITHEYKKEGAYWVILTVEDTCGVRTIKRKVKFEKPEKPSRRERSQPKVVLDSGTKIY